MKTPAVFDAKFFKFAIVGVVNTIVGSAIMFLLYNVAHFGYWLSSASNYIVTSILSFFLNKYFTFGVRQWSFFMVAAFAMTIAVSYLVAYGVSRLAMAHLLRDSAREMQENMALLAGMFIFTGLNYLGQRLIVFRRRD